MGENVFGVLAIVAVVFVFIRVIRSVSGTDMPRRQSDKTADTPDQQAVPTRNPDQTQALTPRKLLFILGGIGVAIGLVIVMIGASQITQYEQMQFDRSKAPEIVPGVRNELGAFVDNQSKNREAQEKSIESVKRAAPYLVGGFCLGGIGVILVLVGLCMPKAYRPNPR